MEQTQSTDEIGIHSGICSVEFRTDCGSFLSYAVKFPPVATPPDAYCFFACPPLQKSKPRLNDAFRSIRQRLEQLIVTPAKLGEFEGNQFLACESLGHEARIKASIERNQERRLRLIRRSEFMYEAGLRMISHSTVLVMLNRIMRHPDEVYIVRIRGESEEHMSKYLRRFICSSFAGLAICALYRNDFPRFGSFASLTIGWDDVGGIHALSVIRVIAMLDNRLEMFLFVTRNVLLPYLARTGREAILEKELLTCVPHNMVDHTRTTVMNLANCIDGRIAPNETHVRTLIHDGSVVEKVCTVCSVGSSDVKLRHCSVCKSIYYCSKKCQAAHWPIHKQHCIHFASE